jgi:hypothetical protein
MTAALLIGLLCLAAICKAIADTLDHHFDTSIFRGKSRKIWDPNVIHKTSGKIFGYPLDAWHIVNSIQLAALLALPLFYEPQLPKRWMDYVAGAIIFIIIFNTFYNKIFRRK